MNFPFCDIFGRGHELPLMLVQSTWFSRGPMRRAKPGPSVFSLPSSAAPSYILLHLLTFWSEISLSNLWKLKDYATLIFPAYVQSHSTSQAALVAKNPTANAGDTRDSGLIPGSERSPAGGLNNPLQYSRVENPMDREAWRATVHRVTKSWTWLKQLSPHACSEKEKPRIGLE